MDGPLGVAAPLRHERDATPAGGLQRSEGERLALPGREGEQVIIRIQPLQLGLRARAPEADQLVHPEPAGEGRERRVLDVAIDVDDQVVAAPGAEVGDGLDQEVDPLVLGDLPGRHDPERVAGPIRLRPKRRRRADDPVRQDLHPPRQGDPARLDLGDELLRAGQERPVELPGHLGEDRPDGPPARPAELHRDVVHQVPDPGEPQMLERRHQPEPADAHQVPHIRDVRAELLDRSRQDVDVVGADDGRLGFREAVGNVVAPVDDVAVAVPDLGQAERAADMGLGRHGGPRGDRQHEDVVAAGAEGVDGLPAAELVAADDVGRVQVREDQDLHAATPRRRAIRSR